MRGQLDPNIAADLTDPHVLTFYDKRCLPQSQVVSKTDLVSGLLERDVVRTTEDVQRADRRSQIFCSEQERPRRPVYAMEIQRLVQSPSSRDEWKNDFCIAADDYEIERIA